MRGRPRANLFKTSKPNKTTAVVIQFEAVARMRLLSNMNTCMSHPVENVTLFDVNVYDVNYIFVNFLMNFFYR